MKLLIAEDDSVTRFMVSEMLYELGFSHESCSDGKECVDLVLDDPTSVGLILMDVHMPRMTGIEALARIRTNKKAGTSSIPVLALTADQHWLQRENWSVAGFTGIVPKPVTLNELEASIGRVLTLPLTG